MQPATKPPDSVPLPLGVVRLILGEQFRVWLLHGFKNIYWFWVVVFTPAAQSRQWPFFTIPSGMGPCQMLAIAMTNSERVVPQEKVNL